MNYYLILQQKFQQELILLYLININYRGIINFIIIKFNFIIIKIIIIIKHFY